MAIRVQLGKGPALAVLFVFLAASPLAAATRTWTGLGGNTSWMTAGNWDVLPAAGDDLVFPSGVPAPSMTNDNNFPTGTSFHSITFTGGNYAIGGNPIQLAAGTSNQAAINQINFGVTLTASQTFASTAGQLTFTTIDLQANTLTFDDSGGDSEVVGVISGTGGIVKNGAGTVRFDGNNTYMGPSVCNAGTLDINGTQVPTAFTVNGGTLIGVGRIGRVTMVGGVISPGTTLASGGVFFINDGLTFTSSAATYSVQINGTTASLSGYDQLGVAGATNLNNATLAVSVGGSFVPTIGDQFRIMSVDPEGHLNGTFNGLPDGSVFAASGFNFILSYFGGFSNDVTLTVLGVAPTPTPTSTPTPTPTGIPIVAVPTLSFPATLLFLLALLAAAFFVTRRGA